MKFASIIILLTLIVLTPQKTFAENIFSDNFNVTGNGDINFQFDTPGRQSGTAAELLYDQHPLGGAYVTNAGPYAGKCVITKAIWPVHNFTESGNFSIEFDLTRESHSPQWLAINLGNNAGNIWPWHATPGFSVVIHNDGGYSTWQDGIATASFSFVELTWSNNPTLKVKIVVSQDGFPATQDARIALFFNDKPYPTFNAGGNKYLYNYKGGFTNNYFTLCRQDEPEIIDNLKISSPSGNTLTTAAWFDDADSGISSSKTYTHNVNLAVPTNLQVNVNGVTFTGAGTNDTAACMQGENWELRTETPGGLFYSYDLLAVLGQSKNIAPQSLFLATNALFNGVDSGGLTLSGLTPDQNYMLTLYSAEFDYLSPNGRSNYFATSDGGLITIANLSEFGANNGQILQYQYTSPASSNFSISATPVAGSAPIAWFAFSNEMLPPSAPQNLSASQGEFTDKIKVAWDKESTADGYTLFRADINDFSSATEIQTGILTNFYDDSSVTIAQDYYYWVSASNAVGAGAVSSSALGFTKSAPPDKPENLSPKDYLSVTSTVILSASTYSGGIYTFSESQWQVASDSGFFSVLWDSGAIAPIETYAPPKNKFNTGTNFWRVKYKNDRNTWSDYSDGTSFTYVPGANQAGMFRDTFDVPGFGNINYGYYNTARQYGEISPLSYSFYETTEVGARSDNPGKLLLGQNSSCLPNYDFTKSGNFKIEFDAELTKIEGSDDWLSISFGKTNQGVVFPVSPMGAGLIFKTDGIFQAFDGIDIIASKFSFQENVPLHIIVTVGTDDFDEGDPAVFSAFVNGIPMPVYVPNSGLASNSYSYTIVNGLDNNYISMYNFNGSGANPALIDNFVISESPNVITSYQWSSDADVPVDSLNDYTHLINLNDDDNATFNGVTFEASGYNPGGYPNGNTFITTNGWALWSAGDWVGLHNVEPTNIFGSGTESWKLARHFGYANSGALALQLTGLTPYSSNTLSIYGVGWEPSGRPCYFSSSYGGVIDIIEFNEYGLGGGIIVEYDYIASANGTFTLAISPEIKDTRGGFHLSAFANEERWAPGPLLSVDSFFDLGGVVPGSGGKTLPLEIANLGGGEVSGTISGIDPSGPFTIETNYYSVVFGTNDNISVTFDPIEEKDYTNIITLTGTGGTAEVMLLGTGVPEPISVICYLSCFALMLRRINFRKQCVGG